MAMRGLAMPLAPEADLNLKTAQMRSKLNQQYVTAAGAAPPLLLAHDQHTVIPARSLPPPTTAHLLSPSWKPEIDTLYHNFYLESLLQGNGYIQHNQNQE